jgi:hypothetical protein
VSLRVQPPPPLHGAKRRFKAGRKCGSHLGIRASLVTLVTVVVIKKAKKKTKEEKEVEVRSRVKEGEIKCAGGFIPPL